MAVVYFITLNREIASKHLARFFGVLELSPVRSQRAKYLAVSTILSCLSILTSLPVIADHFRHVPSYWRCVLAADFQFCNRTFSRRSNTSCVWRIYKSDVTVPFGHHASGTYLPDAEPVNMAAGDFRGDPYVTGCSGLPEKCTVCQAARCVAANRRPREGSGRIMISRR